MDGEKIKRKISLKLPAPNPKLRPFIEEKCRFSIAATGTKVGKTVGCSIWIAKMAWNNPGTKWWWVAPVRRQAKIGFENICKLLPSKYFQAEKTNFSIVLSNGSVIEAKSAEKADHLYGEAVHGAVIDEAARIRESAFHAVRTTLSATGGQIKIISNPKGRNWFYKLFCKGQDILQKDYKSYNLSTYDSPYVSREDIENAKSLLPETVFNELYLGKFIENSGKVFRNFERCISSNIIEAPEPDAEYVIGVDIARYADFTVICVINADSRSVSGWDRFNQLDWNIQKIRITGMSKKYNLASILIDSTGVGDPIMDDLYNAGLPVEGFKFTALSKRQLIETLVVAIEQKHISFPHIPELITELEAFNYEKGKSGHYQYGAPEGFHDDCVIALALANWQLGKFKGSSDFLSTKQKNISAGLGNFS